jgi:hypothetical protein
MSRLPNVVSSFADLYKHEYRNGARVCVETVVKTPEGEKVSGKWYQKKGEHWEYIGDDDNG